MKSKSTTRQYKIWLCMKKRCDNKNYKEFQYYGGRGITYPDQWKTFDGFWNDMSEGYSDDLSLDRINVNLNYSVENCKWSNSSEQAYNRRVRCTNTTGKSGVYWDSKYSKYRATITVNKKRISLGYYDYLLDAIFERLLAEQKYFGNCKVE